MIMLCIAFNQLTVLSTNTESHKQVYGNSQWHQSCSDSALLASTQTICTLHVDLTCRHVCKQGVERLTYGVVNE